jgi:hypothetical protein
MSQIHLRRLCRFVDMSVIRRISDENQISCGVADLPIGVIKRVAAVRFDSAAKHSTLSLVAVGNMAEIFRDCGRQSWADAAGRQEANAQIRRCPKAHLIDGK